MSLVKSVFKVFDGKQKRKLFGMAFLILINSGVSLLGVSVLLPFIQAVTAPEELLANRYVAAFYEWMGMENPNELITAIAIGIVIVYLAKNAFIIFMNNMQYRFSYYGKREMQDRLMKYYISKDYTFFLNHNSAELMRDINNDPEMFYAAVLNMLQLAAELCTSTILIIFLVVTDPIITLGVALAMMLMVLLFMKKLKRTLARFGDERRKYNANIIQCMQQAFGGIKEIKIANRESYFEEEFRKQNGLYTYVIKQNGIFKFHPEAGDGSVMYCGSDDHDCGPHQYDRVRSDPFCRRACRICGCGVLPASFCQQNVGILSVDHSQRRRDPQDRRGVHEDPRSGD